MDAVSEPATQMLQQFFNAIPKILVATIILIIFVVGGRFIAQILKDLLNNLKLNEFIERTKLFGGNKNEINITTIIGNIAYYFIVIFGLLTAIEKLEFARLTEILNTIVSLSGNILFGLLILVLGNWIATIAQNSFSKAGNNAFIGSIIRVSIIAIFLAIGLQTMGIADDIINLAFGITLGTVAVTIALSFGLGGRDAAGKQMGRILNKFNNISD